MCLVKSATTPSICRPGYASASAAIASVSALTDTSSGTNRAAVPRRYSASSSSRVFSDEPEPNSMSVFAPVTRAMSSARVASTSRSARVG